MTDVRPATLDDLDLVARIGAEGFYVDPVLSWVLPDDSTRLGKLQVGFAEIAGASLSDRGAVFLAGGASAAIWRDPTFDHHADAGDGDGDGEGEIEGDAGPFSVDRGPFTADDLARFAHLREVMHAGHPRAPHWYLNVVSTLPSHQSRGLGAAVLQPILERADAEQQPCYLESTNPRNRTLYYRNGFEDMDELHLDGGPSMLQMWRSPSAQRA